MESIYEEGCTLPVSDETDSCEENAIYPGLVLNRNYIIITKIGYGNNASVWLTYNISDNTYQATKIQDSRCYEDGRREISIINKINDFRKAKPKQKIHCVHMFDSFNMDYR